MDCLHYIPVTKMANERIAQFALEHKVEGKRCVGKPKISWLPTTLKRCALNLGEAIETANNRSDWMRLRQHVEAYVTALRHTVKAEMMKYKAHESSQHSHLLWMFSKSASMSHDMSAVGVSW